LECENCWNHSSFIIVSIFDNSRSNSAALPACPGRTNPGAISASGCKTKRRRCARGWGKTNPGRLTARAPKAIKSRSSRRGSLGTPPRCRPNSASRTCSLRRRDWGVSSARGQSPAMALTKDGDPGGQSTGVVRQSDERSSGASDSICSRSNARRRISFESPRLEPRATKASSWALFLIVNRHGR